MYSGEKYLAHRVIDRLTPDNNAVSGGFPHSDIPGSKGALASPGLIAECHVLHRLLLPRHPPNALIALDPIQKKTGPFARQWFAANPSCLAGRKSLTRAHRLGRRRAGCDRERADGQEHNEKFAAIHRAASLL